MRVEPLQPEQTGRYNGTMDMPKYLAEMEHAVSHLIDHLWEEAEEVAKLEAELKGLTLATQRGYEQAASFYDDDDDGIGTMIHWDTYFGPDKERFYKEKEHGEAADRLAAHAFARTESAGSLLEYAKKGLSLVYGAPSNWPRWAALGTQQFGSLIRQTRNQATHWDTPPFASQVDACLKQLAVEIDPVFLEYTTRSLAFEVVSRLGWRTFDQFKADMLKT
jgi:hypothetical protein